MKLRFLIIIHIHILRITFNETNENTTLNNEHLYHCLSFKLPHSIYFILHQHIKKMRNLSIKFLKMHNKHY